MEISRPVHAALFLSHHKLRGAPFRALWAALLRSTSLQLNCTVAIGLAHRSVHTPLNQTRLRGLGVLFESLLDLGNWMDIF